MPRHRTNPIGALGTRSHPDVRGARQCISRCARKPSSPSPQRPDSVRHPQIRGRRPGRARCRHSGGMSAILVRVARLGVLCAIVAAVATGGPDRRPPRSARRRRSGGATTPSRVALARDAAARRRAVRRAGPRLRARPSWDRSRCPVGTAVRSPAAGIVAFAGSVAGRESSPSTTAGARHNARARHGTGRDRRCG
jgi:hypothetical protein